MFRFLWSTQHCHIHGKEKKGEKKSNQESHHAFIRQLENMSSMQYYACKYRSNECAVNTETTFYLFRNFQLMNVTTDYIYVHTL